MVVVMRTAILLLLLIAPPALAQMGAKVGGPVAPDGTTEIHCDLPGSQHLQNKGGSDGAGLCVFTSVDHSARWQNVPALVGFRDYMTRYPGGGWPEKLAKYIKKICAERKLPEPKYVQIENSRDLEPLKLACKTGRMVAVTYERSPTGRYGGSKIAHMVSMPHCGPGLGGGQEWVAILDNNYPGTERYEWMSPEEFLRVCNPRGFWAVILLDGPPPPPPSN